MIGTVPLPSPPSSLFPSLLLFSLLLSLVSPQHCYSCAGRCHNDHCNCQMGSCPSSHCFIERAPSEENGVGRITKGCLRNPSRTLLGCDYDHFSDHVLCVCQGSFCNEHIFVRSQLRRNVTCRKCLERNADCSDTCQGQWCHEDSTTGAAGCGYGPPSLPYFYKGPELLYFRNKLCITMTRSGPSQKTLHLQYKPLQRVQERDGQRSQVTLAAAKECVLCEVAYTEDQANTPSCKQHRCYGHFCTLTAQRLYPTGGGPVGGTGASGRPMTMFPLVTERQGCINVTDSTQMQLGCTHKWMDGNFEELMCACKGSLCNRDTHTAQGHSLGASTHAIILLISILSIPYS